MISKHVVLYEIFTCSTKKLQSEQPLFTPSLYMYPSINIVESGVKHQNPNPPLNKLCIHTM